MPPHDDSLTAASTFLRSAAHRRALRKLAARAERGLRRPERRLTPTQRRARRAYLRGLKSGQLVLESASCACGRDSGVTLLAADRYGLPSPTVLCLDCGLVRTSPRLTEGSLIEFYRSVYRPLYTGSDRPNAAFFASQTAEGARILNMIREAGLDLPGSVADVGCGAGGTLIPFREAGASVAGCDLGPDYLEIGRGAGLPLREGGPDSLRQDGPFDLVILSHVVEHVADPSGFLGEQIAPLLSPGGIVYIELPGLLEIASAYGDPLQYFQSAHLWGFTLATLDRATTRAGLSRLVGDESIRGLYRRSVDPGEDRAVGGTRDGVIAEEILLAVTEAARAHQLVHLRAYGALRRTARRMFDVLLAATGRLT